jgi:hypothetical protein
MRTIINEYIVLLSNGQRLTITASNHKGAMAQAMSIKGVVMVQRVYKTGAKAECPW